MAPIVASRVPVSSIKHAFASMSVNSVCSLVNEGGASGEVVR
jgi:hypothetical protein